MTECKQCSEWHRKYEEASAEAGALLDFLQTELHWEYFRAEMLYGSDDKEKSNASADNARKIANFLKAKGHGIKLLCRLRAAESGFSGTGDGSL